MVEISCPTLSGATALEILGSCLQGPGEFWINANSNPVPTPRLTALNQADSLETNFSGSGSVSLLPAISGGLVWGLGT